MNNNELNDNPQEGPGSNYISDSIIHNETNNNDISNNIIQNVTDNDNNNSIYEETQPFNTEEISNIDGIITLERDTETSSNESNQTDYESDIFDNPVEPFERIKIIES